MPLPIDSELLRYCAVDISAMEQAEFDSLVAEVSTQLPYNVHTVEDVVYVLESSLLRKRRRSEYYSCLDEELPYALPELSSIVDAIKSKKQALAALRVGDLQNAKKKFQSAIDLLKSASEELDFLTILQFSNETYEIFDMMERIDQIIVSSNDCNSLRHDLEVANSIGDLFTATRYACLSGCLLSELGADFESESKFREALAMARQVDISDPFLTFSVFVSCISSFENSSEKVALSRELEIIISRLRPFNPILMEEAGLLRAHCELDRAFKANSEIDEALALVSQMRNRADSICHHLCAHELLLHSIELLRDAGRLQIANKWTEIAKQYENWYMHSEEDGFLFPGHVHSWDDPDPIAVSWLFENGWP